MRQQQRLPLKVPSLGQLHQTKPLVACVALRQSARRPTQPVTPLTQRLVQPYDVDQEKRVDELVARVEPQVLAYILLLAV